MGLDEIYVRDKNLNKIGLIDNAESVIWTNRYFECGDFEIYAKATSQILELCKNGRFLSHSGSYTPMMIEEYKITTDLDGIDYITISGRCATAILTRRVVYQNSLTLTKEGHAGPKIFDLINSNILDPSFDKGRRINNMKFKNLVPVESTIKYPGGSYVGKSVYEAVTDICKYSGFGIKTQLAYPVGATTLENNGVLQVILYVGVDRSKKQNERPAVVFSPSYGNLAESEYGVSWTNYANVCFSYATSGTNKGDYHFIGTATGLNRYETSVDISDVVDLTETYEEYMEMIQTRANEKMANLRQNVAFDGKVVLSESFKYKDDYDLGDIVTMENDYGASETLRIVEVIESLDSNGYIITPVLKGVTETTN